MAVTFDEILDRAKALHAAKDRDYAGAERYGNFRASERFGVPAHVAAFVRLADKFHRAETLLRREADGGGGPQVAESIEDTLLDLLNYAAIVIVLRPEVEA